jgi:thermitase
MQILGQNRRKVLWLILIAVAMTVLALSGFQTENSVGANLDVSAAWNGPGDAPQTLPWIHVGGAAPTIGITSSYTYTIYLPLVLSNPPPYVPDVLLVSFDPETSSDFVDSLAATYGAVVLEHLPEISVYLWQFPPGTDILEIQRLLKHETNVHTAEPDYLVELADTIPNDPGYVQQWALTRIQAHQAWDITRGTRDVVIAVVDTGADLDHSDLASKLTDRSTWYDFGNGDNDPNDTQGHGTHCAGIAAAASNNGTGITGLSWYAQIMPVKVFRDYSRSTTAFKVAQGILYAVDKGADIISLSLGSIYPTAVERDAIEYAHRHSGVVVAAAGNLNSSEPYYPAAYEHVISVASTSSSDRKSSFSNYGTWIDVSAPGSNIYSTCISNRYCNMSGTSMAAPYVAGLASLVLAIHPDWSSEQVEARILDAADKVDGSNPGYIGLLGSGRINAYKTVQTLGPTSTPTRTPTNTPTPTPTWTPTPTPTPPSRDNLWNIRTNGDDRFHSNEAWLRPWRYDYEDGWGRWVGNYGYELQWGPIYTQGSGNLGSFSWNTGPYGSLSLSGNRDIQWHAWTYVYVSGNKNVTLQGGGDCVPRVFLNQAFDSPIEFPANLSLSVGWNRIDMTGYNQNQGYSFTMDTDLANLVDQMNSTQG